MSVGSSTITQAASAGGKCKAVNRTVVDSGVNLRCTQTKFGRLKWRKFNPPVVSIQPVVAVLPVAMTPFVSVETTMLNQSGAIAVTSNVEGTVYVVEVSVKVTKVEDIKNAGLYLWMSSRINKVGVNSINVDVNDITNGNFRVYVADNNEVLSAASLNMVVVSMTRLYDSVSAQTCVASISTFPNNSTDFVMTLDTSLTADNTVRLPLDGNYNVFVNWGDGTSGAFVSGDSKDPCHVYSGEGAYTIRISGALEQFASVSESGWMGANMVTTVTDFGELGIESLSAAFNGAENLIQVPTQLPASVSRTSLMFLNASEFNGDIGAWDVSNVTNMYGMFAAASKFNQNIGLWDVSQVTDMSFMFFDALMFNGDIGLWNVSQVTDMSYMFFSASAFNQNIGLWNVSRLTNMSSMFFNASEFNGDIGSWDVSQVTDMWAVFSNASAFNQNIGGWVTSSVTDMSYMFNNARVFNQNIGGWVTSSVTNMSNMFEGASAFNQNIGLWDVSQVTIMSYMFFDALMFNGDIGLWNVSQVTNTSFMFFNASAFNRMVILASGMCLR